MKPVTDAFLMTIAQISATLLGLFLMSLFFYIQTGFGRLESWGPHARPFFRASAKLVLLLYAFVLGLALSLVSLERVWVALTLVVLSLAVIAGLAEVTVRSGRLPTEVRRRHARSWPAWPVLLGTVGIPWVLARGLPAAEDVVWTLLLAGVLAFYFTVSLLLFAIDLSGQGT